MADFAAFNAFAAWAGAIGLVTGDGAGAPQGLTLLTDHIHRNDTAARAVAELIDTILHEHPTSISHDQVMGG